MFLSTSGEYGIRLSINLSSQPGVLGEIYGLVQLVSQKIGSEFSRAGHYRVGLDIG